MSFGNMKIVLTSVMVDDQERVLRFYTGIPGFVKKTEIPMGEFKWLTVVPPEGTAAVELLLEPMGFPPAKVYQKALFDAGIPLTSFGIDDVRKEFERLQTRGGVFRLEPTQMGPVTMAAFETMATKKP